MKENMPRYVNKQGFRGVPDEADMRLNKGVVSDKVLRAYKKASEILTSLGIEHRVVGGLAVGAWGHPRATKDIDFLVKDRQAFDGEGLIASFKPGVPISVDGVSIDYLTVESLKIKGSEPEGEVVSLEVLFLMKLRVKRAQDNADLIALIKNGADVPAIDEWLKKQRANEERRHLVKLVKKARGEE